MKKQLIKISIYSLALLFVLSVAICSFGFTTTADAEETTAVEHKWYEMDDVYGMQVSYGAGPIYAGSKPAVAVRGTKTASGYVGIKAKNLTNATSVDISKALVIDMNNLAVMDMPFQVDLYLDGEETAQTHTGSAYLVKDNKVVGTLTATDGKYTLNSSVGLKGVAGNGSTNSITAVSESYNKLVIPFSSYTGITGESVSISSINVYANNTSAATVKFTVREISVGFISETTLTEEANLWRASEVNYDRYVNSTAENNNYIKTMFLKAHQLFVDGSDSKRNTDSATNENDVNGHLIFKMPDALIDSDGLVDVSSLQGMVVEYDEVLADMATVTFAFYENNEVLFNNSKLTYNTPTTPSFYTVANAGSSTVVAKDGTVSSSVSGGILKANASKEQFLKFATTGDDAAFTGTISTKVSPYFTMVVERKKATNNDKLCLLNGIRFVTDETVHNVTVSEGITSNVAKAFDGANVVIKATDVDDAKTLCINGTPATADQITAIESADGLTLTVTGDIDIRYRHEITVNASVNGSVSASQYVFDGDDLEITIAPDQGYSLDTLMFARGSQTAVDLKSTVVDNKCIVENVTSDCTITATFREPLPTYAVTVTQPTNGTLTCSVTEAEQGSNVAFDVAANLGYKLTSLTVTTTEGTQDVTASIVDGRYVHQSISCDITVSAVFEEEYFDVAVRDDSIFGIGTATFNVTGDKIQEGQPLELTISPGDDCHISKFARIVDGEEQDLLSALVNGKYTVESVLESYSFVVEFEHDPHGATVTTTTGGTIVLSADEVLHQGRLGITVDPDGGYELKKLFVTIGSGEKTDITDSVENNKAVLTNVQGDVVVEAEFTNTGRYHYELGTMSSLQNSYPGMIWADRDAVNLQASSAFAQEDKGKTLGLTANGISVTIDGKEYIVVELQTLTNNQRSYKVLINGISPSDSFAYYVVNNSGVASSATASNGLVVAKSVSVTTPQDGAKTYFGFNGMFAIPLSAYEGVDTIQSVTIQESLTVYNSGNAAYTRFNLYSISLISARDIVGNMPLVAEADQIWKPQQSNFAVSGDLAASHSATFLNAGDVVVSDIAAGTGRDALWWALPSDLIGDDGFVDFDALGIKGLVVEMSKESARQFILAWRLFDAESKVQEVFGEGNSWQTSQSNHQGAWLYPNGLIRPKSTSHVPTDENGLELVKWYIPISMTGLTANYVEGPVDYDTSVLPDKWNVITRLVIGTQFFGDVESFNVKDIYFTKDDSMYQPNTVTASGLDINISGINDGREYSNAENNRFSLGSKMSLTFTPNVGYQIVSAKYTVNGEETSFTLPAQGGSYEFMVTGDMNIQIVTEAIDYVITYDLDGGTNAVDNPTHFNIEMGAVTLKPATKEGYEFIGWFDENGNKVEVISSATKDIRLTARFEEISSVNGGTIALIVGGSVVGLGAIVGVIFILLKKKALKK